MGYVSPLRLCRVTRPPPGGSGQRHSPGGPCLHGWWGRVRVGQRLSRSLASGVNRLAQVVSPSIAGERSACESRVSSYRGWKPAPARQRHEGVPTCPARPGFPAAGKSALQVVRATGRSRPPGRAGSSRRRTCMAARGVAGSTKAGRPESCRDGGGPRGRCSVAQDRSRRPTRGTSGRRGGRLCSGDERWR